MGFHSKCSRANVCRWGSDTVPGTCGFTSCQYDREVRSARLGNTNAIKILQSSGLHGSVDTPYGKRYW